MFRFPVLILSLALVLAGLAGCAGRPQPDNVLVVGLPDEPLTLDPRFALDAASTRLNQVLYAGLLKLDASGRPEPDLAQDWRVEGGRIYTFRLRPGLTFHDGRDLTARDVVFTYASILDPSLNSPKRLVLQVIDKVEALDRLTVRFSLREVSAPFESELTLGVVPAGAGPDLAQRPVGAGPFSLVEWRPGQRLDLAAHRDYFMGRPAGDGIVFKVVPDDTTRVLELLQGNLDFVLNGAPPDLLGRLAREKSLRIIESPSANYAYLAFNLAHPDLGRLEVRRAIARAVDRRAMIRYLLDGRAEPATGLLPPGHWAYTGQVADYAYDPEAAARDLDRAGLKPDEKGVRLKLLYKATLQDLSRRKAEVLQDQLARVGIKLEIRSFEWATFFTDVRQGNFQLCSLEWVGLAEPDIYYHVFHSQSRPPQGANRGGYANPELDRLLIKARQCLDREERAGLYARVQQIVARDLPYLSLWHPRHVLVLRRGWTGFELTPQADLAGLWRIRRED